MSVLQERCSLNNHPITSFSKPLLFEGRGSVRPGGNPTATGKNGLWPSVALSTGGHLRDVSGGPEVQTNQRRGAQTYGPMLLCWVDLYTCWCRAVLRNRFVLCFTRSGFDVPAWVANWLFAGPRLDAMIRTSSKVCNCDPCAPSMLKLRYFVFVF